MNLSTFVQDVKLIKCNRLLKRDDLYFVNLQDEDGNDKDIYELYITDEYGKELFNMLKYPTAYIHDLKIYVVGITHYGISWNDIEVNETVEEYLEEQQKKFKEDIEEIKKLCELAQLMLDNIEVIKKHIRENPKFKKDMDEFEVSLKEMDTSKVDYMLDEIRRLTA